MKYNLSLETDRISIQVKLNKLKSDGVVVEMKEVKPLRSLAANAYLHVCLNLFAIHTGSTLYEAKIDLKRLCAFMHYEKAGKKYLRETHKMQSDELAKFTEWVRNYSANEAGYYILSPEEYKMERARIDNLISSHKEYL